MANVPSNLKEMAASFRTLLQSRQAIPPEYANALYQMARFDSNDITLQEIRWMCDQRAAEVLNLLEGKIGMKDFKETIDFDKEFRYLKHHGDGEGSGLY